MKKSTIAIPVALALLSFGVSTQTMALEVEDVVVPVATGQDSTAVGVNDTLNDNEVANDEVKGGAAANDQSIALNDNKIEVEDIGNDKSVNIDKDTDIDIDKSVEADADVDVDGDYNAVTTIGDATVDKSIHVKVKDVNINTLKSDVKGEVEDNYLSFGKDLEQKSYGNSAEAENSSYSSNKSYQEAEVEQYNKSYQKLEQEQSQDSDQEIKQFQANKEAALNASLQAEKSDQDNDATGVNVPVGVNVSENEQSATPSAETDQEQEALTLQANKSDDPANKAIGENESEQDADAKVGSKQGDQKNIALAGEKSDQDQDQDAANKSDQDNKAKVANKADLENTTTQVAVADAGKYVSIQKQTVYLSTGDNSMSGFSMNGVNAVAQNSGVQSFNQITQNVQLNLN